MATRLTRRNALWYCPNRLVRMSLTNRASFTNVATRLSVSAEAWWYWGTSEEASALA